MRYLSVNQLSEITGKDRRTIKKRLAGVPVHSTEANVQRYDTQLALEVLYSGTGSRASNNATAIDADHEAARLKQLQADIKQIELDRLRGQLIPIEEVVREIEHEYAFVRAKATGLPSRLAKPLATESNPEKVFAELSDAINEFLEELTADAKRRLQLTEIQEHGFSITTGDTVEQAEDPESETEA